MHIHTYTRNCLVELCRRKWKEIITNLKVLNNSSKAYHLIAFGVLIFQLFRAFIASFCLNIDKCVCVCLSEPKSAQKNIRYMILFYFLIIRFLFGSHTFLLSSLNGVWKVQKLEYWVYQNKTYKWKMPTTNSRHS